MMSCVCLVLVVLGVFIQTWIYSYIVHTCMRTYAHTMMSCVCLVLVVLGVFIQTWKYSYIVHTFMRTYAHAHIPSRLDTFYLLLQVGFYVSITYKASLPFCLFHVEMASWTPTFPSFCQGFFKRPNSQTFVRM